MKLKKDDRQLWDGEISTAIARRARWKPVLENFLARWTLTTKKVGTYTARCLVLNPNCAARRPRIFLHPSLRAKIRCSRVDVFGRFFGSLWIRFALCRFKFALAKNFWLKALWHHPYESTYEKKKKSTSIQPDTRRRYKAESQH